MKIKFFSILAILMFGVQFTHAQQQTTVTGTVTDDTRLPLPGVNVLIEGTNRGVQTDFDGDYAIEAAPGEVLVFSFLGMETARHTFRDIPVIDVTLAPDDTELEEVVVTAFGGTKQRRAATYATSTVDASEINTVSSNSLFENLSGKVAGVDITSPAQPGASSKVIIRGYSSISGSNAPLYVIDGTPMNAEATGSTGQTTTINSSFERTYDAGNAISDIDPNTIEKITILKGAAATALYGNRAANGAILITTKRSKRGGMNINLSSSVDYLEVSRVPHFQNGWGQGWSGLGFSALLKPEVLELVTRMDPGVHVLMDKLDLGGK
ncbi:TonB-dependent receptor plug domain-containing protein [Antarcticibacterium sp. 1MA-6-2]|uniref:TonB-dependent receptor plug domain-containing protein n=1 Tax=Antarcticibacterium sp. 1MA-6-2 TaxID=2908210 RepID=UPI001F36FF45|nr:TonB-dependent receptor plug domain-containing protein [Antarcticibacterium sp. 1MA-6-2]UJH92366.1 TonB-dependent receptor plug domain-containing protein [Antarcticibacterium sp. 1MA-6-2]